MNAIQAPADQRDLMVSRIINVPRAVIWRAWSEPEHFARWWAPAPVVTTVHEHDLRPGGSFSNTMRTPDGKEYPTRGCFLDVRENERIVFTDALEGGWRPAEHPFFTAIITMDEHPDGTLYSARALHANDADRQRHVEMGFDGGWKTALEQLARVASELVH